MFGKPRNVLAVVLATAFTLACSEAPVSPDMSGEAPAPLFAKGGNGVIQHVSVGSNDICPGLGLPPGCDANFSLVANKWADGTVRGQWHDEFGKDENGEQLGGVHVSIDCIAISDYEVGIYSWPIAWVSGVVTRSSNPNYGVGDGVITLALDRGTSENDPFEDLLSFTIPLSVFPEGTTCTDMPELPVGELNTPFIGQVKIWSK